MYTHSDTYEVAVVDSTGSRYYLEGLFTFEKMQEITGGFLSSFPATDDLAISKLYIAEAKLHVYIDHVAI